jgi:hypothetical protein
VVGPSKSLKELHVGHIINKFDIVIRINRNLEKTPQYSYEFEEHDYGKKTDIIFNNFSSNSSQFIDFNNIKIIHATYPFYQDNINYKYEIPPKKDGLENVYNMYKNKHKNITFIKYDLHDYDSIGLISDKLNLKFSHPTSGLLTLYKLINYYDYKSLFICGFSFLKLPSESDYKPYITHNYNNDFLIFQYILNNTTKKNIYLDRILFDLIKSTNPNIHNMDEYIKYLKYKTKYLKLKEIKRN